MLESLAFTVIVLAIAFGMSMWASKARTDRSANVGLYIVFGSPAVLLIVAGAAFAISGSRDGVTFLAIGLGLGLPLLKQFRVQMARITNIDPASPIDMVGLSLVLAVMSALAVIYLAKPSPDDSNGSVNLTQLLFQVAFFVALAFILVGTGVYRTFRESIARLGLDRKLTPRIVAIALGAVIVALIISSLASIATREFQPEVFDQLQQVTKDMTADVQNPLGALILGLSAGIGEELLLRGALQPRFGIFITSLLFALLHTQYGLTFVLVGLFLIGAMLGKMRVRYGTAAPIITHAVFNLIVVLAQSAN
jgi:membrane protease YdiL (CAAX protease family)